MQLQESAKQPPSAAKAGKKARKKRVAKHAASEGSNSPAVPVGMPAVAATSAGESHSRTATKNAALLETAPSAMSADTAAVAPTAAGQLHSKSSDLCEEELAGLTSARHADSVSARCTAPDDATGRAELAEWMLCPITKASSEPMDSAHSISHAWNTQSREACAKLLEFSPKRVSAIGKESGAGSDCVH